MDYLLYGLLGILSLLILLILISVVRTFFIKYQPIINSNETLTKAIKQKCALAR